MSKVLGVLGGMGPAATLDFLAKLQAATPATGDADHIRAIVDINPQVPNRHEDAERAAIVLAVMAASLREAGAEVLAMPCNSAHGHAPAIIAASGLPFIDMIDQAVAAAREGGATRIGVIATPTGLSIYEPRLREAGLEPVLPDAAGREAFMAAVYRIKAGDLGDEVRAAVRGVADALIGRGAQAVIAGCTEAPLAIGPDDLPVPFIDATEALARACVEACLGEGR